MEILKWLRRKRFTTETGYPLKQIEPLRPAEGGIEYLAVPLQDLTTWVLRYVDAIEVSETRKYCRCIWKIHPDDSDKPAGMRRMRRIDDEPDCPVHTKEGFLTYFFEWLEAQQ